MRKLSSLRITTFIGISHFLIGIVGVGIVANAALYAIFRSGQTALVRASEDQAYVIANMLLNCDAFQQSTGNTILDPASKQKIENNILVHLVKYQNARYAVYYPDTTFLIGQPEIPAGTAYAPEVQQAKVHGQGSSIRTDSEGQRRVFTAARIEQQGKIYGIVQLGVLYSSGMQDTFHTMAVVALVGITIVLVILWVGWRSSIFLSEPVVNLSHVAEKLSQGDLSARAEIEGPVEVVHLAQTLNSMAARVQSSLDTMQAFVANASHELRTPLTGIKLQVGALRSGAMEDPEVAGRFLEQVENEIDRLSILVNDLLDLSQLESKGIENLQPVDLTELASEALSFWDARSQQAGLELSLQSAPNLPPAFGEPYCLRRLLDNLVDNAIKNTPEGGRVQIVLKPGQNNKQVRIEIHDTGSGIPTEHLPRIFDRFYRIEMLRTGSNSGKWQENVHPPIAHGSGLGLAIARTIVLAHGGSIGVESTPGRGSVFWVEIPSEPAGG